MSDIYYNIKNKILEIVKLLLSQKKYNIVKIACNFYILLLKLTNC